jgi:lipoate-protein ligase B
LLAVEHYPVYTIGIRRKEYGSVFAEGLKKLGADFVQTNRGGLITFHGPGNFKSLFNLKL